MNIEAWNEGIFQFLEKTMPTAIVLTLILAFGFMILAIGHICLPTLEQKCETLALQEQGSSIIKTYLHDEDQLVSVGKSLEHRLSPVWGYKVVRPNGDVVIP